MADSSSQAIAIIPYSTLLRRIDIGKADSGKDSGSDLRTTPSQDSQADNSDHESHKDLEWECLVHLDSKYRSIRQ